MGKLTNIYNRMRNGWRDIQSFGMYVGVTNMLWPFISKLPNLIQSGIKARKKRKINGYLEQVCRNSIRDIQRMGLKCQTAVSQTSELPIFVCWLQGEESAPDLVKACINSIRKHAVSHPVYIITAENYSRFVTLPEYVIQAWYNKRISNAHFADVMRSALLCEHGGCWLDATIWMSSDIQEEVFERPFYSCRFPDEGRYVTQNMWSNFFIASHPHSATMSIAKSMMCEYVSRQTRFIDYFLMDYIIRWGYDNVPDVHAEIDAIPENNLQERDAKKLLSLPYNSPELQMFCNKTYIHKLSWRIDIKNLPQGSLGRKLYEDHVAEQQA